MTKKITGLTASGQTQPEVRRGDIWRDSRGGRLTVTSAVFNRVTFIRDGYEFPCTYPQARFSREFSFVSRENKQ